MKPTVARMLAQLRQLGDERSELLPWLPDALGFISVKTLCTELMAASRQRQKKKKAAKVTLAGASKTESKTTRKTKATHKTKAVRRTEGPRRRRSITPELQKLILSDMAAGKSVSQAAREFRISRYTLQQVKKQLATQGAAVTKKTKKKSAKKKVTTRAKATTSSPKKPPQSKSKQKSATGGPRKKAVQKKTPTSKKTRRPA